MVVRFEQKLTEQTEASLLPPFPHVQKAFGVSSDLIVAECLLVQLRCGLYIRAVTNSMNLGFGPR